MPDTDNPSTPVVPVEPPSLKELRRALDCLYIAVDSSVAQDVCKKANAFIDDYFRRAALTPVPVVAAPDIEAISARVHDSWIETKRAMGFHGDNEPCPLNWPPTGAGQCPKYHPDLIPYEQLSEAKKELDRATVRAVLKAMSATTPSPVSREPQFICRARKQGTAGGHDPADCDWPRCGCDPYANKVLDTIDESGFDIVPKPEVSREPISAEQWLISQGINPKWGIPTCSSSVPGPTIAEICEAYARATARTCETKEK